jgi:AcrR family transcriptional regulator
MLAVAILAYPDRMRARSYHHGDLRAALLARAEETLREKGAEALSLRELARDLGVSHAAPSRHFKDRRALLDALALTGFDQLTGLLATAAPAGGTFRERLSAQAQACVDFAVRESAMMGVMFSRKLEARESDIEARAASATASATASPAAADPGSPAETAIESAAYDAVHAAWMRLSAPVFAVIADGQRSGDVHEGDVERIAMSVFIVVHGVSSLAAVGILTGDEVWSALDDALDHLVRGLKPGA